MADNRFPLFRLPFLALCMIMDFYSPHDIIQLSLCSKRSLRVAKKCWKKKDGIKTHLCAEIFPKIDILFSDPALCYRFVISKAHDAKDQQIHHIRIGDAVVSSIHKETETVTYWQDKIFGIGQIISYIKALFNVPITKVFLKSEHYKNEFIDTMDCLMKIQESVPDCILETDGPISDRCLTHLLDSCKITEELRIYRGPTRKFRNDWKILLDTTYISNGSSLTFQNLTNIDCKSLELYHSSLTSEDMNQFLKHWQNGGNSRIRYACIKLNSMNHDVVTAGIETVPKPWTLCRYYPLKRNYSIIKRGGLDIQRNEGTTGTVYMDDNKFEFGVDPIKVLSG